MAVEVRYVGTRSRDGWSAPGAGVGGFNYNEFNITDNGFLKEFRQAQANLQANLAANNTAHVRLHRRAGHRAAADFPRLLQRARIAANAGNPALYTGGNWTNATFLGFLAKYNPNPFGFASNNTTNGLQGNATFRDNALTAGRARELLRRQPGSRRNANVVKNYYKTRYNALQLELRRRYSQGLPVPGELHLWPRVRQPVRQLPQRRLLAASLGQHRRHPARLQDRTRSTTCPSARGGAGATLRTAC